MRPVWVVVLVLALLALVVGIALLVHVTFHFPDTVRQRNQPPTSFYPVLLASTTNVDMHQRPWPLVDQQSLPPGERVLLKEQTDSRENGIWLAPITVSAEWTRAPDLVHAWQLAEGATVFVQQGELQHEETFVLRLLSRQTTRTSTLTAPGQAELYFLPVLQHLFGPGHLPSGRVLQVDEAGLATWATAEPCQPLVAAFPTAVRLPRILHLIYGFWDIDQVGVKQAALWRSHNPSWQVRVWTPVRANELVCAVYAEWLPRWNSAPHPVMQVDLLKWFVLHHEGGVYVDTDVEPCPMPEELLGTGRMALWIENDISTHESDLLLTLTGRRLVAGPRLAAHTLASVPHHPLARFMWEHMGTQWNQVDASFDHDISWATGSDALTHVFRNVGDDFVDVHTHTHMWCHHARSGAWKSLTVSSNKGK